MEENLQFDIRDNTFMDADGDTLTWSAFQIKNGKEEKLPDYMNFNSFFKRFEGVPNYKDYLNAPYHVRVKVSDGYFENY